MRNRKGSKVKYCFKCGVELTENNWYISDKNFKSPKYKCKFCSNLFRMYSRGISKNFTAATYNELFIRQQGYCAICGIHQSKLKGRFCVDHNHTTGEIRKLLCKPCNLGIGNFKADKYGVKLLLKAIKYIEEIDNGTK